MADTTAAQTSHPKKDPKSLESCLSYTERISKSCWWFVTFCSIFSMLLAILPSESNPFPETYTLNPSPLLFFVSQNRKNQQTKLFWSTQQLPQKNMTENVQSLHLQAPVVTLRSLRWRFSELASQTSWEPIGGAHPARKPRPGRRSISCGRTKTSCQFIWRKTKHLKNLLDLQNMVNICCVHMAKYGQIYITKIPRIDQSTFTTYG